MSASAQNIEPLVNLPAVAELLGVHAESVREMARDGLIPAYRRPGTRRWKFRISEVLAAWKYIPTRSVIDPGVHGGGVRELDCVEDEVSLGAG
jgi:excisionase family DNA binding protein